MSLKDLIAYGTSKKIDLTASEAAIKLFSANYNEMFVGKTWYVKQGGTGDGTKPETPLGTIQAACTAAASGDTVKIAVGAYDENLTVDGLRITKALKIVGTGASTRIVNSNVAATSAIHLVGDTGITDISGLDLSGILVEVPAGGTYSALVIDQDFRFPNIHHNFIIGPDAGNYCIFIDVKRPDRIIQIHDNLLSGGLYNIYAKAPDGTWAGDAVVIFIERNTFLISGQFSAPGTGAGIYIQGDAISHTDMGLNFINYNTFMISLARACIHIGNEIGLTMVVGNTFGQTLSMMAPNIVNLLDENVIGASGFGYNVVKENKGMLERTQVSQENADGIGVSDGFVAPGDEWKWGAWTTIIAAASMTKHFRIKNISFIGVSADDSFAVQVAKGSAGVEEIIASWAGGLSNAAPGGTHQLNLEAETIPPNSRIAIRIASSNGSAVSNSLSAKIIYNTME
jgi:hypothetical protein